MGATHFLTRTLPKVATEMALSVLAYNLTRVMNIVGVKPLIAAMRSLRSAFIGWLCILSPAPYMPLAFSRGQDPKRAFDANGPTSNSGPTMRTLTAVRQDG